MQIVRCLPPLLDDLIGIKQEVHLLGHKDGKQLWIYRTFAIRIGFLLACQRSNMNFPQLMHAGEELLQTRNFNRFVVLDIVQRNVRIADGVAQ